MTVKTCALGSTSLAEPLFSLWSARFRAWISTRVLKSKGWCQKMLYIGEKKGQLLRYLWYCAKTLEMVEEPERSVSINCQRKEDWMLVVSRVHQYLLARSGCELQGPHGLILLHLNCSLPVTLSILLSSLLRIKDGTCPVPDCYCWVNTLQNPL